MSTTTSTTADPPPPSSIPPPQTTTTTTTKPSTILFPLPLTHPTTTTTPPPKPPQILLHHHHHHQFFPPQTQPHTSHYPFPFPGRGLIPSTTTHHTPSIGGSSGGGGIHPRLPEPGISIYSQMPGSGNHDRANPTQSHNPYSHIVRPSFLHHQLPQSAAPCSNQLSAAAVVVTDSSGGSFSDVHHPISKAGSSLYSVPDINAPADFIDKKPDDLLITLRGRKVRVSDRASLYALCRSWLRNGHSEEIQSRYGEVLMSLPKPLPLLESSSPKRKERDDEIEVDEVNTNEILSAGELLKRHVNRAKRVRARLREERSQRIERYKCRLTLIILPPNETIQE